jgi:hypothetical protein
MKLKMETQNNTIKVLRSVLSGVGAAISFLLLGTVLDYVLTQILSQYFLRECSEDCYFRYFNTMFTVVAFLSVAGGALAAIRTYKRSSRRE